MLKHLVNNKVGQLVMSAEGVTELSVIVIDIFDINMIVLLIS